MKAAGTTSAVGQHARSLVSRKQMVPPLILRYTISPSVILNGASATITGSFRELISNGGNSITAYVYKNSTQLWTAASANGSTLTQANGTFNLSTTVAVGDTIDFVVYNNGNLNADETAVRGMIGLVPEPGSLVLLSLGGLFALRRRRG